MLVCRDAGPRRSLSGKVRLMVCAEEVLPPFRRGNSCFSSDRAPRRHLTGPARPAGLRGKCPPASACGGCLLLDFAPKAYRPRRAVGSQACRNASAQLCACGPPCKSEHGCECPWGRNQGGGVGRRPTPEDIRPQGHSHPAPCRSADETLSPQSGAEPKNATRAALSTTARVSNLLVRRRTRR